MEARGERAVGLLYDAGSWPSSEFGDSRESRMSIYRVRATIGLGQEKQEMKFSIGEAWAGRA